MLIARIISQIFHALSIFSTLILNFFFRNFQLANPKAPTAIIPKLEPDASSLVLPSTSPSGVGAGVNEDCIGSVGDELGIIVGDGVVFFVGVGVGGLGVGVGGTGVAVGGGMYRVGVGVGAT